MGTPQSQINGRHHFGNKQRLMEELMAGFVADAQARIAHHWTRSGDQVTDLVWHLRYDDEYLRTPAGWRIHGRKLTINAIETRSVRRLRDGR